MTVVDGEPEPAAEVVEDLVAASDAQPASAPVDFEEWALRLRGTPWRTLLAGFMFTCRTEGKLRQKFPVEEWDAKFHTWREQPTQ